MASALRRNPFIVWLEWQQKKTIMQKLNNGLSQKIYLLDF
jgi:hypothetical protein